MRQIARLLLSSAWLITLILITESLVMPTSFISLSTLFSPSGLMHFSALCFNFSSFTSFEMNFSNSFLLIVRLVAQLISFALLLLILRQKPLSLSILFLSCPSQLKYHQASISSLTSQSPKIPQQPYLIRKCETHSLRSPTKASSFVMCFVKFSLQNFV